MIQADLFTPRPQPQFGTEPYKMVRRTDPVTSVDAACSVKTSELESLVYEAIKTFGHKGCIANDVEALFPNRAPHSISPRFKPLKDKGLIVETGEKRMGRYGKNQIVVRAI